MRPNGPTDEAVAGHLGWKPQVAAWLGGQVLQVDVPIIGGRVSADVTQAVPEKVTCTIPRYSTVAGRKFDWLPGSNTQAPLARYGQTLTVQIVTTSSISRTSWTNRFGRYRIQDWGENDDGDIEVEAVGMMQRVAGDDLPTQMAPLSTGTLASEFMRLLPQGFSVSIDPSLVDRPCPQSLSWSEDRLAALYSIADAWPARLRTSEDGWRLLLLPPLPDVPAPLFTFADGVRGTAVSAPAGDTRDGTYNRVRARISGGDDPNSTPIEVVVDAAGALAPTGDYGPETYNWATPIAKNEAELRVGATTLLANKIRPARKLRVQASADPRVDLDDPARVLFGGRPEQRGYVLSYDMPLQPEDGDAVYWLGVGS